LDNSTDRTSFQYNFTRNAIVKGGAGGWRRSEGSCSIVWIDVTRSASNADQRLRCPGPLGERARVGGGGARQEKEEEN